MKTEKEYLEKRIADLREMRSMYESEWTISKHVHMTKREMICDMIDELETRLEEIREASE